MAPRGNHQRVITESLVVFSQQDFFIQLSSHNTRAEPKVDALVLIPLLIFGEEGILGDIPCQILIQSDSPIEWEVFIRQDGQLSLLVLLTDMLGGSGARHPVPNN